jgi:hypothetical protein
MFAITDAHIDFVHDDLSSKGVRIDDLRNNIVDHICILAERDLGEEDDFAAWYQRVIPTFYRQQLSELEEETQFLLKHRGYFAILNRFQFLLVLVILLIGPIIVWMFVTAGEQLVTETRSIDAWQGGLVFAIFPVLLLMVLFLTPDRYDPLIPRRAKILIGWKPLVSIVQSRPAIV